MAAGDHALQHSDKQRSHFEVEHRLSIECSLLSWWTRATQLPRLGRAVVDPGVYVAEGRGEGEEGSGLVAKNECFGVRGGNPWRKMVGHMCKKWSHKRNQNTFGRQKCEQRVFTRTKNGHPEASKQKATKTTNCPSRSFWLSEKKTCRSKSVADRKKGRHSGSRPDLQWPQKEMFCCSGTAGSLKYKDGWEPQKKKTTSACGGRCPSPRSHILRKFGKLRRTVRGCAGRFQWRKEKRSYTHRRW